MKLGWLGIIILVVLVYPHQEAKWMRAVWIVLVFLLVALAVWKLAGGGCILCRFVREGTSQ